MTTLSERYERLSVMLDQIERDARLEQAERFAERMDAIDTLEFDFFGAPDSADAEMAKLMQRAEALKQRLDDANNRLFYTLRAAVRDHAYDSVTGFIEEVARQTPEAGDGPGYDALDMLVNGLLETGAIPQEAAALEADLVFYQPTPARIVLKLTKLLQPTATDVFYDIGSGLGHVPILMHLLTGIRARGVELEASYCDYASVCAANLGLGGVDFIHADARQADLSDGTIFYLYTPFLGEPLQQVLGRLAHEAEQRPIRIGAYGPCTTEVARQPWLKAILNEDKRETGFGVFETER